MLRRKPTRIELKGEDIAEFEAQRKRVQEQQKAEQQKAAAPTAAQKREARESRVRG